MADESKSEGEVAPDVPEAIAAEKAHRGMDLMQLVFELTVSDDYVPDKAATKAAILKQIEEDSAFSSELQTAAPLGQQSSCWIARTWPMGWTECEPCCACFPSLPRS